MKLRLKRLSALAGLLWLVACLPQTGGGDVCLCATPWVVTATLSAAQTIIPTPTATPTAQPTPTRLPPMITHTPDATDCPRYPGAAYQKGFEYVFTDKQQAGLTYQNVRFGPGTQYAIMERLYLKDQKHSLIYFAYNGWVAINVLCTRWAYTALGDIYPSLTD